MSKIDFRGFCSENPNTVKKSESFRNKKNKMPLFFENQGSKSHSHLDSLMSPEQVAQYLNVSRKFIYERLQRGELQSQKVGRLRRIRKSTLEAWLTHQNDWR